MGNQTSVLSLVLMLDPWYAIRFFGVANDLAFSGKRLVLYFKFCCGAIFLYRNSTFHFLAIIKVV